MTAVPVRSQRRRPWTVEEQKHLLSLHAQGWSDERIAAALGRTLWSTATRRRALGLPYVSPAGTTRRRGPSPKAASRDPEVRRKCVTCRGPVYIDEPGANCPDCQAGYDSVGAAHLEASRCRQAARENPYPWPTASGKVGGEPRQPTDAELMRWLLYS